MEETERLVWEILRDRERPESAITAGAISRLLGSQNGRRLPERNVRAVIQNLIVVHGLPIASTTKNAKGYFMAVTEEDRRQYVNQLKSRLNKTALRLRAFERNTAEVILGQLKLGFPTEGGRDVGED